MRDQVPHATKHTRMQQMLSVARASRHTYLGRFAGRVLPVLWERSRNAGEGDPVWDGLTGNYIRVSARSHGELRNRMTDARLLTVTDDGFDGEVL
jgi:tRNA A37 methylthiotransferase MiaB